MCAGCVTQPHLTATCTSPMTFGVLLPHRLLDSPPPAIRPFFFPSPRIRPQNDSSLLLRSRPHFCSHNRSHTPPIHAHASMTINTANDRLSSEKQTNGSASSNPRLKPSSSLPPRPSRALISPTEALIVAVYPATLVLASLFYHLSPSDATTFSYFSGKRNILNIVFVKYGWLWTTAVFLFHLSRLQHSSRAKAAVRWGLATLWWVLITQWCFGPPIMDRTFLWTGGGCRRLDTLEEMDAAGADVHPAEMAFTSAACKLSGGRWTGGHDLSGHVFLLTHASLFLWSELLPSLKVYGRSGVHTKSVLAILGMWWWMLLMTGVYFHTVVEKVRLSLAEISGRC